MVQEKGLQRGFLLQSNSRATQKKVKKPQADTTCEPSTPDNTNKTDKTVKAKKNKGLKSGFLLSSNNKPSKSKATPPSNSVTSQNNNPVARETESRDTPSNEKTIKKEQKSVNTAKSRNSGLSKGFLLSAKAPKPKKQTLPPVIKNPPTEAKATPISTNQDLLFLEAPNPPPTRPSVSNSLLFLEDTSDTKRSDPPLSPWTPTSKSPLIAVLDEDEGDTDQESKKSTLHAPLEQESKTMSMGSSSIRQVDDDDEIGMVPVSSRSRWNEGFVQTEEKTKTQRTPLDIVQQEEDEESFLEFQQWLSELKWKRNSDSAGLFDTVPDWAKAWTPPKVSWAWDWIHSDIGKKGNRRIHSSVQALVWSLLSYHPTHSLVQYSKLDSPSLRQCALATVLQLQELLDWKLSSKYKKDEESKSLQTLSLSQWSVTLLRHVCPLAVQVKKRTVLAQESWKASMQIIVLYANDLSSMLQTANVDHFFVSQQLDKLLQTQFQWKQKKKDTLKGRVTLCIIQSWIELNKSYNASNTVSEWRDHILGYQGDMVDMNGFGGLIHSFLSSSEETFDILSGFSMLAECRDSPVSYETVWRGLLNIHQQVEQLAGSSIQTLLDEANRGLSDPRKDRCLPLILSLVDCVQVPLNKDENRKSPGIRSLLNAMINVLYRKDLDSGVIQYTSSSIVKMIVHDQGAAAELDRIFADHALSTPLTSILATISDETKLRNDHDAILSSISTKVVNSIAEISEIRKWLKTAEGVLLLKLGLDSQGSALLNLLCIQQIQDARSNEIQMCVLEVLTNLLFESLSLGTADAFVGSVCNALSQKNRENPEECSYVCETLGQYWHKKVLDQDLPPSYFAETLISVAKMFLAGPSSVAPLSLFGFLVGDEHNISDSASYAHLTTTLTTFVERVVDLCAAEINRVFSDSSKSDVFDRLAPLLILRRVPVTFFCISKQRCQSIESLDLDNRLIKLACALGVVLELGVTESLLHYESTSEKRVAAEVAGRTLSLGSTDNHVEATLFTHVCLPAFQALLGKIDSDKCGPEAIPGIRQARVALYACCHHMPVALEQCGASATQYYCVAQFALLLLRFDSNVFETQVKDEFSSLQMGCSEFLGLCVWCDISSITRSTSSLVLPQLPPVKEAFATISRFVNKVLQGTKMSEPEDHLLFDLEPSLLQWPVIFRDLKSFSTLQSNLWKILIPVVHRCQKEDGSEKYFAEKFLPVVCEYVCKKVDTGFDLIDTNSIVSTLQILSVFVSQAGSLASLSSPSAMSSAAFFRKIVVATQHITGPNSKTGPAATPIAQKLLLVILAVGLREKSMDSVYVEDDVLSLVEDWAAHESQEEIKTLSREVLQLWFCRLHPGRIV